MSSEISRRDVRRRPGRVQVIVNPAPAHRTPLLWILNRKLRGAGILWDVSITHESGDGTRLAREAVEGGADVVAVYGGDGTVVEVAAGLLGTDVPLLILPGGTGNLVAAELRLPSVIERCCDLICAENFSTRLIDAGMMNGQPFVLRVGCGIETGVVTEATRELKKQFGKWAYAFAGIKTLQAAPEADYEIRIDGGEAFTDRGMACVVANAGTVGVGRLTLAPSVDVQDGRLDVFFLKKATIEAIFQLFGTMTGWDRIREEFVGGGSGQGREGEPPAEGGDAAARLDASKLVQHWSASSVEVRTDPVLDVQVDGDVVARTPLDIAVKPGALRVVV